MSDGLWMRARADFGITDATLAGLLSCSVEEIVKWRAEDEPTPDVVERHLKALCDDGGLWHTALVDRPKATRILPGGRLAGWVRPLLFGAVVVPFLVLLTSLLLGFTFTPAPWLDQAALLVTGVITLRLAMGLARLTGPRCSLCGEHVRRRDEICSGCQAELT